jgi:hypothetical protein
MARCERASPPLRQVGTSSRLSRCIRDRSIRGAMSGSASSGLGPNCGKDAMGHNLTHAVQQKHTPGSCLCVLDLSLGVPPAAAESHFST